MSIKSESGPDLPNNEKIGVFEKWIENALTHKSYNVTNKFIRENQVIEKLKLSEHARMLFRDNFASYYISKLYGTNAEDINRDIDGLNMEAIPLMSQLLRFNKMTGRVADRISTKLIDHNDLLSKILENERKISEMNSIGTSPAPVENPRLVIFAANLLSTTFIQSIRNGVEIPEKIQYQLSTIKVR